MTEEEYQIRIHELEKQVARLQSEIKRNSETNYGLRWMDVPEAFDAESENKIPTLEEVKELAINNNDGKPTHILIEGDNYHALTCLNYTHKGKIDVIYIDPPYNTGSDGFVYKDKRILDKFPDGTTVPTDHPLRHSYWLSFMEKRLRLAKNLLSKTGVIFISIDDNEYANLKLLCDQIFGEKGFINNFMWLHGKGKKNKQSRTLQQYILAYCKGDREILPEWSAERLAKGKFSNPDNDPKGNWFSGSISFDENRSNPNHENYYTITSPSGIQWTRQWQCGKDEMSEYLKEGKIYFGPGPDYKNTPRLKIYEDETYVIIPDNIIDGVGTTKSAQSNLDEIIGKRLNEKGKFVPKFENPKPQELIAHLVNICSSKKDAIILDFFAGSGTSMHAIMELNNDGGSRQCILIQTPENNICHEITYLRNRNVIFGEYTSKKRKVIALGNSLKFYRTSFVGEHTPSDASDFDKTLLAQKAGCLLALSENNLEEIVTANSYQIFALRDGDKATNDCKYTAVYFSGNLMDFPKLRQEIEQLQAQYNHPKIAIYVFCWGDASIMLNEFDDTNNLVVKDIPQPILDIYTKLNA